MSRSTSAPGYIFKVRTFRADVSDETWDFGDGRRPREGPLRRQRQPHDARGHAETTHRFARAGHYIVRVEGLGHNGLKATAHLQVRVGE